MVSYTLFKYILANSCGQLTFNIYKTLFSHATITRPATLTPCHCLSYDALTAHVSLVFIRYMLLSLQQRNNCDDRTISELFLLMIDELADISFGHALQLIVDIMLQMIQERFGLSDAQLDEFVTSFIERLPISYQHALRLKGA